MNIHRHTQRERQTDTQRQTDTKKNTGSHYLQNTENISTHRGRRKTVESSLRGSAETENEELIFSTQWLFSFWKKKVQVDDGVQPWEYLMHLHLKWSKCPLTWFWFNKLVKVLVVCLFETECPCVDLTELDLHFTTVINTDRQTDNQEKMVNPLWQKYIQNKKQKTKGKVTG